MNFGKHYHKVLSPGEGGWLSSPYNGLYWGGGGGGAPPKRGIFFRLEVYKRVEISRGEVKRRVGKSVIWVFKRAFQNTSNRPIERR